MCVVFPSLKEICSVLMLCLGSVTYKISFCVVKKDCKICGFWVKKSACLPAPAVVLAVLFVLFVFLLKPRLKLFYRFFSAFYYLFSYFLKANLLYFASFCVFSSIHSSISFSKSTHTSTTSTSFFCVFCVVCCVF